VIVDASEADGSILERRPFGTLASREPSCRSGNLVDEHAGV